MPSKVITFGISKGGASKSTSSGIVSKILSEDSKVLCIDLDGQGNLTSLMTNEYDICLAFEEATILEALKIRDVRPYTLKITENLHLVPSNDFLALLPKEMYRKNIDFKSITDALEPVFDYYDYIIIDTPPSLGEATIMGLSVEAPGGSYAVTMFDGSKFCYYAIPKFHEIIEELNYNKKYKTEIAGILFAIIDQRAKENRVMEDLVDEEFPGLRFDTIIKRKAATRRLSIHGFDENTEIRDALMYYYKFTKELKERVGEKTNKQKTERTERIKG